MKIGEKKDKTDKKKASGVVNKDKKLIEELRAKCEEYLNGWKRAQADYHNLEREIDQKKSEWIKMANADLLAQLLPIYDNLKLALKHVPEEQKKSDWVVGIEHIKNQLNKLLEENGVEEIKTVGEKFNPELHEAVSVAKSDKHKKEAGQVDKGGLIKEEVRPGYKLSGKVFYPAKVIVNE